MAMSIVILAAGKGKRMCSSLPKVLHPLAGKTLLENVVKTATKLNPSETPIVIYGHQGEIVRQELSHLDVNWVAQTEQLGTGHALQQALPHINLDNQVLVLYGDVPLISETTLQNLMQKTPPHGIGMITAHLEDPSGLGRIIRDVENNIVNIIEHKDLLPHQLQLSEINSGIYLFPGQFLAQALPKLTNNNNQKEYYLTDVVKIAAEEKLPIQSTQPLTLEEIMGVNDRVQLAFLERAYQRRYAEKLMQQGVTLLDPARFDARGELSVGQDVVIDINVILEGRVVIGNHCRIGPHCILRDVVLQDGVEIKANSILEESEISANCVIGPFARIRPGTVLNASVHVGNFVEIKNSQIDEGTKINHLSYIGDSTIGKRVNIGAGTITCNYDGAYKHRTSIEDDAFIGSNTALVAPITVGVGATIGAGSTLTRTAPPHQLTLSRARQQSIENWHRPKKKET